MARRPNRLLITKVVPATARAWVKHAPLLLPLALIWFVVFPIGFPYIYTHTGPVPKTPSLGVPSERIAVTTSDSIDLAAWYVPSKNRAAVIVFPGPARATDESTEPAEPARPRTGGS